MTDLSLRTKYRLHWEQLRAQVALLPSGDGLKEWFCNELDRLRLAGDETLALNETNARLVAVRQLNLLLADHLVQLQNPELAQSRQDANESYESAQSRLPAHVLERVRETHFSIDPELLLTPPEDNELFDAVSPTAKVVGYLRNLDESLRFAESLSFETEGESLLQAAGINSIETRSKMGVLFQSRYHAVNLAVAKRPAAQIVELAAGISPRGLQWSREFPGTIYVESDLPQLMKVKAKLIRNTVFEEAGAARGILHCCAADALDFQSLNQTLDALDTTQPITIVTEGLLLYFSEDEMHLFWSNMAGLMAEYPQVHWITDLVTRQNLQELFDSDPGVAHGVKKVFSDTGRSVVPSNPFQTEDCIRKCATRHGIQIEKTVSLSETVQHLNPAVPISPEDRNAIVGTRKIWTLVAFQSVS